MKKNFWATNHRPQTLTAWSGLTVKKNDVEELHSTFPQLFMFNERNTSYLFSFETLIFSLTLEFFAVVSKTVDFAFFQIDSFCNVVE